MRTGRVTSLADFGAFVNIDGADGLVHLSEISWERIKHPNEVLEVGQEVQVKVISVDRDRKRIGLSIRQLQRIPGSQKVSHLREGMLVEGTVTHLTKFGAFASIGDDLEGLIHVSELSEQRIAHPKEVVREGDVVTLRVIKIDPERRRIGLSLRKVDSPAYADLDWKMALADEVAHKDEEPQIDEQVEAETPSDETAQAEIEEAEEPADRPEEAAEALEELDEASEEDAEALEELDEPTADAVGSSGIVEPESDEVSEEAAEVLEELEEEPAESVEAIEEPVEEPEEETVQLQ